MGVLVPDVLLAKSAVAGRPPPTIEAHTLDVERAAVALFEKTAWGDALLRFFRVGPGARHRWLLHLRLACLFHDVGKANADFMAAVCGSAEQTFRHEHISATVLHLPEVKTLLARHGVDVDAVAAAVLTHHQKASPQDPRYLWCQPRTARSSVAAWFDHPEIARLLDRVARLIGSDAAARLPGGPFQVAGPWAQALGVGRHAAKEFSRALAKDQDRRAFATALKAGLAAADGAASGLTRVGESIDDWIAERANRRPLLADEIESAVIGPRAAQIARKSGRPFTLHPFQVGVASRGRRVLLLAGCGTGKTLAAWGWAQERAREEPFGRVVFLYPTRATAAEGFRDYVAWAPGDEGALLSGTARYELEAMAANPPDSFSGHSAEDFHVQDRLFALGVWHKRYFSATVDQFFGFLENQYSSLCLLPALADSALIVDEVHSFDRTLFDALVAFVRTFDLPVLCMTATLPRSRRDELVDAGLTIYPTTEDRPLLVDLAAKEEAPRYRIRRVAGPTEALAAVLAGYRTAKRVLWVVNTVARAQGVARRLAADLGAPVLCYHSRYRLSDRTTAHQETVQAFQQREDPAIAVTTQVCEMSLDLDADVLVSELAPIPALVQRLGRANRYLARGIAHPADVWFYEPKTVVPYEQQELDAARELVAELGTAAVSQRALAEALERLAPPQATASEACRFMDGGYHAVPGVIRDGDEFTTPCVLDVDRARVEAALAARKPIDGWLVPVPARHARAVEGARGWPSWLKIASGSCYEQNLGFITAIEEVA